MPGREREGELARLRWQCRRGMLELDEILDAYVRNRYLKAGAEEQDAFRRLLDHQDPELQQWLLLGAQPVDKGLAALVRVLRQAPF